MSTPNPGDVLPLWNPDIPGEEIQTGRLGIRVRPGTPAAAKVLALEAAGGAELLRQVLEDQRIIDGIYTIVKPEKPLETVELGDLGYWPPGSAFCIFFGPTPMSRGDEIRPASPVNVFGTIVGDPSVFKKVRAGTQVRVERV